MTRKLECLPETPDFVCVDCPGLGQLEQIAEESLYASSTVFAPLEMTNGTTIDIEVPRGSVFDHPGEEQIRRIFTVIYSNLSQQQPDVLQCAEQCRLLPARDTFYAASNTVSVCRRPVVAGRREDDFYQIWSLEPLDSRGEDPISAYIDEILPLEPVPVTD